MTEPRSEGCWARGRGLIENVILVTIRDKELV